MNLSPMGGCFLRIHDQRPYEWSPNNLWNKRSKQEEKRCKVRLFPQKRVGTLVNRALTRCKARPCLFTRESKVNHLASVLHVHFLFCCHLYATRLLMSTACKLTVYTRSFFRGHSRVNALVLSRVCASLLRRLQRAWYAVVHDVWIPVKFTYAYYY